MFNWVSSLASVETRKRLSQPWPCAYIAGELNFVLIGVLLQMLSIGTESTRLTLVQILLQVGG